MLLLAIFLLSDGFFLNLQILVIKTGAYLSISLLFSCLIISLYIILLDLISLHTLLFMDLSFLS